MAFVVHSFADGRERRIQGRKESLLFHRLLLPVGAPCSNIRHKKVSEQARCEENFFGRRNQDGAECVALRTKKRKEGCIMKKIMFLASLVLVLSVPALATVTITGTIETATVGGDVVDTGAIIISYVLNSASDPCVRAFALDITVQDPCGDPAADAHIVGVNEAELNVDYWVYPGSIDINEAGEVNDFGTPIADPCQLPSDTQGGLGTTGVTIEMGSLYVGGGAPPTSGVLMKLYVDDNCLVNMSENVSRGGVVEEGVGAKASHVILPPVGPLVLYNGTDIAQWRAVGKPMCWTRSYAGDGRQCHGNTNGAGQGLGKNKWVFTHDTEVYRAAYNKTTTDFTPETWGTATVADIDAGATAAIKNVLLICADTAHDGQGLGQKKRVFTDDTPPFRIVGLGGYYNTTSVPQDCPPGSP